MSWNTPASAPTSNTRWFWQPPAALALLRLLLAGLALLALWLAAIPLGWQLLLLTLVVLDMGLTLWRLSGWAKPARRQGLAQLEQQWWHWTAQRGWQQVRLLPSSLVWSWLVVLELQPLHGRKLYLLVPWYVLPTDDFRRLRVALRFSKL